MRAGSKKIKARHVIKRNTLGRSRLAMLGALRELRLSLAVGLGPPDHRSIHALNKNIRIIAGGIVGGQIRKRARGLEARGSARGSQGLALLSLWLLLHLQWDNQHIGSNSLDLGLSVFVGSRVC